MTQKSDSILGVPVPTPPALGPASCAMESHGFARAVDSAGAFSAAEPGAQGRARGQGSIQDLSLGMATMIMSAISRRSAF